MPVACPTPCTKPGCPNLVSKAGLCPAHLAEQRNAYNRVRRRKRDPVDVLYATAGWRAKRAHHLRREPLCRHCYAEGLLVAAVLVDHIVPAKDGGAFWDDANLQSLCNLCHERKSHAEGSRFGSARTR